MKFKGLKRCIRTSFLANNPLYHYMRFKMREKDCYETIHTYIPNCPKDNLGRVKRMMQEAVV